MSERGVLVMVTDLEDQSAYVSSVEIMDEYALIVAGSAKRSNIEIVDGEDGTKTHLITITGVREQ